jgi:hypothetical protein
MEMLDFTRMWLHLLRATRWLEESKIREAAIPTKAASPEKDGKMESDFR